MGGMRRRVSLTRFAEELRVLAGALVDVLQIRVGWRFSVGGPEIPALNGCPGDPVLETTARMRVPEIRNSGHPRTRVPNCALVGVPDSGEIRAGDVSARARPALRERSTDEIGYLPGSVDF